MEIVISPSDFDLKVTIVGPVAERDREALSKAFDEVAAAEQPTVILDLGQVPILNSASIGKIILLYRRLERQKRNLVISAVHENLLAVFSSIKLDKMLTIAQQ